MSSVQRRQARAHPRIASKMTGMATNAKATSRKAASGAQCDERFGMLIKPQGDISRGLTVRFGGVTVVAPHPEEKSVKRQIAEGRRAMTGLTKVLGNPGVKISKTAGTPVFRADPRDPTLVIQVLDDKITRGRFTDGRFVPLTAK